MFAAEFTLIRQRSVHEINDPHFCGHADRFDHLCAGARRLTKRSRFDDRRPRGQFCNSGDLANDGMVKEGQSERKWHVHFG
jgi:hypothetical protein